MSKQHPGPWKWFKNAGTPAWSLEDADGIAIIEAMEARIEVRTAIAAVPELIALLREERTTKEAENNEPDRCTYCGDDAEDCQTDGKCWAGRTRTLLGRIDEAG